MPLVNANQENQELVMKTTDSTVSFNKNFKIILESNAFVTRLVSFCARCCVLWKLLCFFFSLPNNFFFASCF